ncbi:hypothetical protein I6B53_02235 [Schaalia sp. 19OD2882]|uniref:hypothetical protein n=1 Tax=Schaalia sp. 19OD2882 TaxID=2794089 RepID=UPI001C1EA3F1|nr:hypothetical protein [Schaalia sp. 19OD2882]QWW19952.1 hypothetical protein I6B53_02235 [Schaalia sp. 19OD2882]
MSNLDQEIADALAKVERRRKKKRVAEEKERARFAEAVMAVLDEIENVNEVMVGELLERAQVKAAERVAKRRRAAAKAAASRREAVSEALNESVPQPVWGEER